MLRLFDENGPNGSNDHACLQGHLPGDDLIDAREEGEEDGGEGGEGKEELALCLWGRDGREGVPNVDSVQFRTMWVWICRKWNSSDMELGGGWKL